MPGPSRASNNMMEQALNLGSPGFLLGTPPRAQQPQPTPPERTFYGAAGMLDIAEGMQAEEALGCIAQWPARLFDVDGLLTPRAQPGEEAAARDAKRTVERLVGLLRRDMLLASRESPTGPTLAIMGLLVPVEVLAVRAVRLGRETAWCVEFLAQSPDDGEVRMTAAVKGALAAVDRDLLYALAPALAAFLHAHGIGSRQQLLEPGAAEKLARRSGSRPAVPGCVLAPALSDRHVGRRLAEARAALQTCGYHVPSLAYLALEDQTLEDWLRLTARGVDTVARKIEEVDALYQQLAAAMADLCALARLGGLTRAPNAAC